MRTDAALSAIAIIGRYGLRLAHYCCWNFLLVVVAISIHASSCDPVPSGIVAWWPAENNATDIVGGNNGTLMNGTGFASGEVGMAFNLNGINNFVVANPAAPTNLDIGQGSGMTIEGWINPATISSSSMMLVQYERVLGGSGSDVGIQFGMDNIPNQGVYPGCLSVNLVDTTDAGHVFGTAANLLTAGVWQHVAVTYDKTSGIAVLYANGVPAAEANFGVFTPQTSFTNVLLGATTDYSSPANPGNVYSGLMDEMSLYNRALSSNEIAAIYLAGSAGKCTTPTPPVITLQPTNQAAVVSSTVTFNVTASGTSPLYYQWSFDGTNIAGATNAMLTLTNVQVSQSGNYSLLVTNLYGFTNSMVAVLSIYGLPPFITVQPTNQTVFTGGTVIFSAAASGTPPLAYQWRFNGTNLVNATNTILTLLNVQLNQAGNYSLFITNSYGVTNSVVAVLAVQVPPSCDPPPSGIVAWWPGEGNALDSVAGNNGTLMNGTGFAAGEVGMAFNLNGINNFVVANPSSPTNLDVGKGSGFTIEGWIRPASISSSAMSLVQYERVLGGVGTDVGIQFAMNVIANVGAVPGCLGVNLVDTNGASHIFGSAANVLTSGVWQHVAMTYDKTSGTVVLYANGVPAAQTNLSIFAPQTSFTNVLLGATTDYRSPASPANLFSGQLDEMSLYNRALGSNEIAAIYQAGMTGKCPLLPVILAQPTNQLAGAGGSATFGVTSAGSPILGYQWQFNGASLPGATNSILNLTNISVSQAGNYDVVVANFAGSVTSSVATLNVPFILVEVNGQPVSGTVSVVSPATVSLLGGYSGGYLFYTIDGSTPTTSSALYTGPFVLTNSATVQTLALSSDFSQTTNGVPVTIQIIPTYNLQTSIVGSGTLSTNPPGGVYASNSVVTLTATPALHWTFVGWAGDTNGSQNPLSVTMNGPRNIQAVFVQNAFPLTLTTPGGGTVSASGYIGTPTYYQTGAVVTLTATPGSGWTFVRWQGTVNSTNNPLGLVMNQTNVIQGIFGANATTNSAGGVIVLSQTNPIPYGTSLAVSAVPNPGNYFAQWNSGVGGTISPARLTVTSPSLAFGAYFSVLPAGKYAMNAVVNGNGFVTVSLNSPYYTPGTIVTLTASTNPGAYFFGWSGSVTATNNPLTVQVNSNEVIYANFGVGTSVSVSPMNLTVFAGTNATLSASAMGFSPLFYQWQNSLGAIPGATNALLVISNIQPANAGGYWVVVSNSLGMATSSVANVAVIGAPVITNSPVPVTVIVGHAASYAVGAYGAPALAYQWRFNGANLTGATNAIFTIPNALPANAGNYVVAVTNFYGGMTSGPAGLMVLPLNILVPAKQVNGQFQITFDTAQGINYQVQYSTDMINWSTWLYLGGTGQPITLTDPSTSGNAQRFYRIVLSP